MWIKAAFLMMGSGLSFIGRPHGGCRGETLALNTRAGAAVPEPIV